MSSSYPTRKQLAQYFTQYVLANSPLTTVGAFSALQAIANAAAAVVENYFRNLQVSNNQIAQEGVYTAFDFSPLSPQQASGTVSLYGTPGTYVPQGTLFSTVGSSSSPAVLFSSQQAVYLLAADPTQALSLSYQSGTSSLSATTYYVTYAYVSSTANGPTLPAPLASITLPVAGDVIVTSVTLPVSASGVNIYIGTTTQPLLLGTVYGSGTITYSGSATSGLSVSVNGAMLTITISAVASSTGSPPATVSSAGTANVAVLAVDPGSNGNVGSGQIVNIVSNVPGLNTVTNPTATSGGTDTETLDHLQSRFATYRNSLSRGTAAALVTAAEAVSGVQQATAVTRAYLICYANQGATWTDISQEVNSPKGVPVNPLPSALAVGNAVYFGANRILTKLYFDVAVSGSGFSATWQYLNATGNWVNLTTTLDQTNNGQQSGTVAWTPPSDWAQGTVNGTQAFWLRLYVTSSTATAVPQWYQVLTLDPPPGYVNLYIVQQAGATGVLQAVQQTMYDYCAFGVTVIVQNANTYTVNVTANVIPTTYGATLNLGQAIQNSIANLFSSLEIGQPLYVSEIYQAITSLYNGQAVAQATVTSPVTDIYPSADTLITLGTVTVTIGQAVP